MAVVGGVCFLFADRAFMAFGKLDFVLAELLGIGLAFVWLGAADVARHEAEGIEWQEANEEALKELETPSQA